MAVLWTKVNDEVSIPGVLTDSETATLAGIFSGRSGSPFRMALQQIGIHKISDGPILQFIEGVPYFNASMLVGIVSCGTLTPIPGNDLSIGYNKSGSLLGLARLAWLQFKLEHFIAKISPTLPETNEEQIEESIALGVAIQALILRAAATPEDLARWLARPETAPRIKKPAIERISSLQSRRNKLSSAWVKLFNEAESRPAPDHLPAFFWDHYVPTPVAVALPEKRRWRGLPISPGTVSGPLTIMNLKKLEPPLHKGILAFAQARPETTKYFDQATAVIFAEGGAVAHACSIARERGIPCVAGLGRDFLILLKHWEKTGHSVEVNLDGLTGDVSVEETK